MATSFDPYHQWLGIPPEKQPPHFYQLLDVPLFEADSNVIRAAANRRLAKIRELASEDNLELSKKIYTQVHKAGVTLLDPRARAQYDQRLKAKLAAVKSAAKPAQKKQSPGDQAVRVAQPIPDKQAAAAPPAKATGQTSTEPASNLDSSAAVHAAVEDADQSGGSRIYFNWRFPVFVAAVVALIVGGVVLFRALPQWMSGDEVATKDRVADGDAESGTATPIRSGSVPTNGSDDDAGSSASSVPSSKGDASTDLTNGEDMNPSPGGGHTQGPTTDGSTDEGGTPMTETGPPDPGPDTTPDLQPDVPDRAPRDKHPQPQREPLRAATAAVRSEYLSGAKTPADRLQRAQTMIQRAAGGNDEPATVFALCEQACLIATAAGDLGTAWRALDEMESRFEMDGLSRRAKLLDQVSEGIDSDSAEAPALRTSLMSSLEDAVANNRFDVAGDILRTIETLARKWRDASLLNVAKANSGLVQSGHKWQPKIEKAQAALDKDPAAPEPNMLLGEYYCFVRKDWLRGLGHLEKCGEPKLAGAAELELTAPDEPAAKVEVAEAWLEAAAHLKENNKQDQVVTARMRSRKWMTEAWAEGDDLLKNQLENRMIQTGDMFVNSMGMKFLLIPPGEFLMGSPPAEPKREFVRWRYKLVNDPVSEMQHPVRISKPFYMGMHEVTKAQFEKLMKPDAIPPNEDGTPASHASWQDASDFCLYLTKKEQGHVYRLPTEAEWEYACRAGTTTAYYFGDHILTTQACFAPGHDRPKKIGSYPPNGWGLFDMHGNMYEWVADRFYPGFYEKLSQETSVAVDPKSLRSRLDAHILRGGCYKFAGHYSRSACRFPRSTSSAEPEHGLRLVLLPNR